MKTVAALRQQLTPEILAKSCHPRRRARLSCPNNNRHKLQSGEVFYELELFLPEETCAI